MIRSIWVLSYGAILTLVLAGRVIMASWFRRSRVPCVCDRMARLWGRSILRRARVRVRLLGAEKVDWNRPLVVIANHQSWFDVFSLLGYLPGKARFVGKQELVRIPIFGKAWQVCGHVSVDRSDRGRAVSSLDAAGRRVRDESLAVIFFPEGTRSSDGRLQSFKKGAFVLALKTGVPVVPVGISGSREVMPKGSFRIRPGEIRIRVGDPIPTDELGTEVRDDLLRGSRRAVAALIEGESTGPEDEPEQNDRGRNDHDNGRGRGE